MATPSSSATTPSPRPRFLQSTGSASSSSAVSDTTQLNDREDRERLAQKVTADAQLGELALNLRARLLYANFKVKSNATNNTFHELDSQLPAGKHTPNGKRAGNYFQDAGSPTGGQTSRSTTRKGAMAPPPPVTASAAQSLFSSLLAPPPAKRARTIHNPDDPPIPGPENAIEHAQSPTKSSKTTRTPDTHVKPKSRKSAKDKSAVASSGKGKGKGKGKQRVTEEGSIEVPAVQEREIDMVAAATLTTLLLNQQRPSVSVTAGSPRSSISAGSDQGSTHSFAHFAQSSARTVTGATPTPSTTRELTTRRSQSTATPPHSPALSQASPVMSQVTARRSSMTQGSDLQSEGAGTPKMTPRDRVEESDAVDMLLLMATSPSPARPSSTRDRDTRDAAAFRALRSVGSGLKGRVLFSSYDQENNSSGGSRKLSRDTSGSFGSMSSTTTEPVSPRTAHRSTRRQHSSSQTLSRLSTVDAFYVDVDEPGNRDVPMFPTVTPPTPTEQVSSQLLPPVHTQHIESSLASNPEHPQSQASSNRPKPFVQPLTPNPSFNLSDYMNVSPSPASTISRTSSAVLSQTGRRLFEDASSIESGTPPPQIPGQPPPFGAGFQR